jgi:DNA invertase Pin-like site-specific DNA recombinase
VQREAIEAYAEEIGGEISPGMTIRTTPGGDLERPGFQAILNRLREHEIDGIVVMKVDRFARSVADGATIVRAITGAQPGLRLLP